MSACIDISDNDSDEVTAENRELSLIIITNDDFQLELRWEQAESLYKNLKGFFDES